MCLTETNSESLLYAHFKETHSKSKHFQRVPKVDGQYVCVIDGCNEPRRWDRRIMSYHLNRSRYHTWKQLINVGWHVWSGENISDKKFKKMVAWLLAKKWYVRDIAKER